jgi:hypothetical protein
MTKPNQTKPTMNQEQYTKAMQVSRACALYNLYTSPSALRTGKESVRNRKAARNVRLWLHIKANIGRVTGDYWESESGRMISNQ